MIKKKTSCDSHCLFKSSEGWKTSLSFALCSWNWFQTLSTQMKMMNLLFPIHSSDQNISILDKGFSRNKTKPLTYSIRGRQSKRRPRSQQSILRMEMNESTCFQLQMQKQVSEILEVLLTDVILKHFLFTDWTHHSYKLVANGNQCLDMQFLLWNCNRQGPLRFPLILQEWRGGIVIQNNLFPVLPSAISCLIFT